MPEQESTLKTVDINDTELPEGPATDIDKEADAFEIPPPPPAGTYRVKWFLGEKGHQLGHLDPKDKKGTTYYMSFLEGKIVEPKEYEDRRIFANTTTTVFRGAVTSQSATICNMILKAMGKEQRVEGKRTAKVVAKFLGTLLKKEPVVAVECDWDAFSADEPGRKNKYTGETKLGKTIVTGMQNFPSAEDGMKLNYVTDKRGTRCFARLQVTRWLGKEEKKVEAPIADLSDVGELGEEAEVKASDDDLSSVIALEEVL